MILEIEDKSKLPISLEIIQKSFATVADEFNMQTKRKNNKNRYYRKQCEAEKLVF